MPAEYTIGEADAWRAGRDACARELRAMAARMRKVATLRPEPLCLQVASNAATLEIAADALAEMEPEA